MNTDGKGKKRRRNIEKCHRFIDADGNDKDEEEATSKAKLKTILRNADLFIFDSIEMRMRVLVSSQIEQLK